MKAAIPGDHDPANSLEVARRDETKAWNAPLDTPENEKAGLHGKPAFK
jgi:hypothetical protein